MSARSHRERYVLHGLEAEADLKLDGARLHGRLTVGGRPRHVEAEVARAADGTLTLRRDGRVVHARVAAANGGFLVSLAGRTIEVPRAQAGRSGEAHAPVDPFAVSPMTGLVAKVAVAPGAAVASGAPLFVVEAMKMEYVVRAPRDVTVREVKRKVGERVALGEVVVTFAEPA